MILEKKKKEEKNMGTDSKDFRDCHFVGGFFSGG